LTSFYYVRNISELIHNTCRNTR